MGSAGRILCVTFRVGVLLALPGLAGLVGKLACFAMNSKPRGETCLLGQDYSRTWCKRCCHRDSSNTLSYRIGNLKKSACMWILLVSYCFVGFPCNLRISTLLNMHRP